MKITNANLIRLAGLSALTGSPKTTGLPAQLVSKNNG